MPNRILITKIIISISLVIFGIITCINPIYPNEQFLQHMGTILLLIIPFKDYKDNKLGLYSFFCICIFILIHIVGARYIYSYVPYNEWFGLNISERNHFDRFVHFMFGVLFFPYLYELTDRNLEAKKIFKVLVTWSFIQTFSLAYEIFEWSLSIFMSNDAANNYNGQQGDYWDAQKDMALAMLGSSLVALIYLNKSVKE